MKFLLNWPGFCDLQWHIQSFFEQTSTHIEHMKFSKFVPSYTLNLHFLALSVLRFLFKTFSKLLRLTLWKTLFRWWFLKNSYLQIKNLYGYKLVRAAKQSELKRCNKYYRRNHMKRCKLFTQKKNQRIALFIIIYCTFVDSFFFCFNLFSLIVLLFCLHFCILSHFKIIRCIVK